MMSELLVGFGETPFSEEEIPRNAATLLERVSWHHPEWRCFGTREFLPCDKKNENKRGLYEWMTFREVYCYTACLSRSLEMMGIKKGNAVVIMSANRPEWSIVDIALNSIGAITVPIYDSQGRNDIIYVINHSEAVAVFISLVKLPVLVDLINEIPRIKSIIGFDDSLDDRALLKKNSDFLNFTLPNYTMFRSHTNASMDESDKRTGVFRPLIHEIVSKYTENAPRAQATDNDCYRYDPPEYVLPTTSYKSDGDLLSYITDTFHTLINKGFEAFGSDKVKIKLKTDGADLEDPFIYQYTSGTIGSPKGAVLSTRSVLWAGRVYVKRLLPCYSEGNMQFINISYLPNAHIFQHVVAFTMLMVGSGTAFFQGSIGLLMDDVSVAQPHLFPAVPRVLNKFVESVTKNIECLSPVMKLVFFSSYDAIRRNVSKFKKPSAIQKYIASNVFKKIRYVLGGRIETMASGSAPLSSKTAEFIRVVIGCNLIEGYGLSETTAIGNCQLFDDMTTGNVGHPVAGMELKLVSVPELDYFVTDKPYPRGEVLYRGPGLFMKYFKDEERTRESLSEDGWFRTGDVGAILETGALKIIDRRSNIFKLAQGEFIASSDLEEIMSRSPYIAQCVVYGNRYESYTLLIANININAVKEAIPEFEEEDENEKILVKKLCSNEEVIKLIHKSVIEQLEIEKRKSYEIPRALLLDSETWSAENGMATPSLKLKANKIKHLHRIKLSYIYKELNSLGLNKVDVDEAAKITARILSEDAEDSRSYADSDSSNSTLSRSSFFTREFM